MTSLETIHKRLSEELGRINDIIAATLRTPNELMNGVVTSYLRVKGKQIRPILVLLSAQMFGEVNRKVIDGAAALEMLHNASLIHDDVVDETDMRRGYPTINSRWGNRIAVLVGDYFVSNALKVAISTGHIDIVDAISQLGCELSMGEIDQICNVRDHDLTEASYFSMIEKKTASLFLNCVRIGADAVGAAPGEARPLIEYARLLGLCFQIKDDIFDYFDSPEIGKPTGNDLREGKVTLPLLHALATAPAPERDEMVKLLEKQELEAPDITRLIEFAKAHGGIDYAFAAMRRMQQEADVILEQYPDTEARRSFRDIFEYIISRNK